KDIEISAVDLDDLRVRQMRGPLVDVAAYRGHGRDLGELVEHLRLADVAGVNDHVASDERGSRFRPQQAVRIRDDADDARHGDPGRPPIPGRAPPSCSETR